jgi:hypothetical protein
VTTELVTLQSTAALLMLLAALRICWSTDECTEGENYSNKFSALQEVSTVLQCFISFQVFWSHESGNVTKQMEYTSNLLEYRMVDL